MRRMNDVLFVCVRNAGRSQMAEAIFNHLAKQRGLSFRAASAGTSPAAQVQPEAREALAELGIELPDAQPKRLTPDVAASSARMITMGCGVDRAACPAGTFFSEDWGLDDPDGATLEEVRRIRDRILQKVEALLEELSTAGTRASRT
jgi:arsenate reductase (thioredoxin)